MIDRQKAVHDILEAFEQTDQPPELLNKYDQLECLAAHHDRETFLLSSKSDGRLCVSKCYDRTLFDHAEGSDLLRGLKHEGLPELCDTFSSDSLLCIVREYIEGEPLSAYARENELTQGEIVDIMKKLADILIFLHSQEPPIIHRDIKPENVIIRPDGGVALIDFDIARTFKQEAEADTVFFGTKGYAPPEQYGFQQTDCRADIYSFGVLLRYLLTDSVRDNKKIRVYGPLQRIIDRCTAFAPKDRYASMGAVRRALEGANPLSQAVRIGTATLSGLLVVGLLAWGGWRLYRHFTYNPLADSSVIPRVMPDVERQAEAVAYMQVKFNTHIFDDTADYFTTGLLKDLLIEAYGMDEDYVRISSPLDPPQENPDHFLPWTLDDSQYVDRDFLAYFVTKVYWPEVVADWSKLRENPEEYPGMLVALDWCETYGILTGVNRPRNNSLGEAAIAFANADRVFTALQASGQ